MKMLVWTILIAGLAMSMSADGKSLGVEDLHNGKYIARWQSDLGMQSCEQMAFPVKGIAYQYCADNAQTTHQYNPVWCDQAQTCADGTCFEYAYFTFKCASMK